MKRKPKTQCVSIHLDDLIGAFGERIGTALRREIDNSIFVESFQDEYDCADNFRVAEESNSAQMADMERRDGCCGRAAKTLKVGERFFIVAWNYGH